MTAHIGDFPYRGLSLHRTVPNNNPDIPHPRSQDWCLPAVGDCLRGRLVLGCLWGQFSPAPCGAFVNRPRRHLFPVLLRRINGDAHGDRPLVLGFAAQCASPHVLQRGRTPGPWVWGQSHKGTVPDMGSPRKCPGNVPDTFDSFS